MSCTPGPWEASFAENSGYDCMTGAWSIRSVPAQRFLAVLDLGSYGQRSCQEVFTSAEAEANARLMATAPDLLAALRLMLERHTMLVNSGDCGNWNPEDDAEVIAARAAIQKAEGR